MADLLRKGRHFLGAPWAEKRTALEWRIERRRAKRRLPGRLNRYRLRYLGRLLLARAAARNLYTDSEPLISVLIPTYNRAGLLVERGVASVLRKDGVFAMLCFSEKEPADWGGPRRVSRKEIETSFETHLALDGVRDARFATRFHGGRGGYAYLTVARNRVRPKARGTRRSPARTQRG